MQRTSTQWLPPPSDLVLPENEVQVWRGALDQTDDSLQSFYDLLSPDERERAARYHFEKDRRYFIVGRGMLRKILGLYLSTNSDSLQFSYTPYGKPFLSGDEGSIRFNVSHSGALALFAFSLGRELGVDIEQVRPIPERELIAAQFFSQREVAALGALPEQRRNDAFYTCWTRKEAYIKGIGEGLSLPLHSFDVSLQEPAELLAVRGTRRMPIAGLCALWSQNLVIKPQLLCKETIGS